MSTVETGSKSNCRQSDRGYRRCKFYHLAEMSLEFSISMISKKYSYAAKAKPLQNAKKTVFVKLNHGVIVIVIFSLCSFAGHI